MRQVRLGEHFGERIEILSGLIAGDRVALDPLAAAKQLRRRPRAHHERTQALPGHRAAPSATP